MSDEELRHASFTADDCNAADAERSNEPLPPASTPVRGAALSVLWWMEADEEPRPEAEQAREEARRENALREPRRATKSA